MLKAKDTESFPFAQAGGGGGSWPCLSICLQMASFFNPLPTAFVPVWSQTPLLTLTFPFGSPPALLSPLFPHLCREPSPVPLPLGRPSFSGCAQSLTPLLRTPSILLSECEQGPGHCTGSNKQLGSRHRWGQPDDPVPSPLCPPLFSPFCLPVPCPSSCLSVCLSVSVSKSLPPSSP